MAIWEILLIGVALAMDAFAVSLTNGMLEPKMLLRKAALIAGAYALFQFMMPLVGYYCGYAFSSFVAKIAPWLSFVLLGFIGGKMIFDSAREMYQKRHPKTEESESLETPEKERAKLGFGKLLVQAVATSLDALAVGVTLLAADTGAGLPMHVALCALVIGAITFALSISAVYIGKKAGDKFSDKAELLGGIILVAIGLKILLEGIL